MKVRIKFTKTGNLKYIGHLDVMRYFQKLMRRSKLPICYSEGFSPHQIMSFAMPLGIGCESIGEYVDIEIDGHVTSKEAIERINSVSVPELQVLSFKELPEGKKYNAMASISAGSYEIKLSDEYESEFSFFETLEKVLSQDKIEILKQTKRSETVVDIKPFIYEYKIENDSAYVLVSCGSVMNINPTTIVNAAFDSVGKKCEPHFIDIKRIDMYTGDKENLISLDNIGKEII